MFLGRVWVCCVLSLVPRAAVSQVMLSGDADPVVSQALKKLHEMFQIGDPHQSLPPDRKPPQFMMDLFNAVAEPNGVTKDPKVLEGNVVRSFEDKVINTVIFFAANFDRNVHFFNLSSFGKQEKMIKAEFRLFRTPQKFPSRKAYRGHFYKVSIYELLDNTVNPWKMNLVASRFLSSYNQGWNVFDVSKTVSKWIQNSDDNKGLLVVTTFPSENLLEYNVPVVDLKPEGKNSYLVVFSEENRRISRTDQSPLHGWPRKQSAVETAGEMNSVMSVEKPKSRKTRAAPHHSRGRTVTCRRHSLYVDFEKIGWSGWIISPRGYDAYYCSGTCPFPLGEGLRATNHATVQSIVNALKLAAGVDTPCCVPDKLRSISLLYFDDDENVVLKQYENMVAVSCGCH
ncbi:bone morphogenetic protein 2-B-like [Arapaima gigas]